MDGTEALNTSGAFLSGFSNYYSTTFSDGGGEIFEIPEENGNKYFIEGDQYSNYQQELFPIASGYEEDPVCSTITIETL